jgi:hypothetical protein
MTERERERGSEREDNGRSVTGRVSGQTVRFAF